MGRGYKESEEAYEPEGENREEVAEWEERLEGKEEIPEVEWAVDIERIENQEIREREGELEEKLASGEISEGAQYIFPHF